MILDVRTIKLSHRNTIGSGTFIRSKYVPFPENARERRCICRAQYLHFHPKRFYLYRYTRKFYSGKIQLIEDTVDVLDVFLSIDCSAITLVELTGNRNRGLNE